MAGAYREHIRESQGVLIAMQDCSVFLYLAKWAVFIKTIVYELPEVGFVFVPF